MVGSAEATRLQMSQPPVCQISNTALAGKPMAAVDDPHPRAHQRLLMIESEPPTNARVDPHNTAWRTDTEGRLTDNTFRLTSRKYWDELKRDLKPIYTAVNVTAAKSAFDELAEKWGDRYRAACGCGTTPGKSSSRSWTTTSRSAR
jgi:hypothetical protein